MDTIGTSRTYSLAVRRVDHRRTPLMRIGNLDLVGVHRILDALCRPEDGRRVYGLDPDPARHGDTEWKKVWRESWDQWIDLNNSEWILEGGLINLADGEVDYTFRVERDDCPKNWRTA